MASKGRASVPVRKIVSGGQTGVDQGALDAAIDLGLEHGGWCPKGRLSERGRIADRYRMKETDSSNYAVRTERNVVDSDATLILHHGPLTGGTALTRRMADAHGRPCYCVDLASDSIDLEGLRRWLAENRVEVLNVAGPRASSYREGKTRAYALLSSLLGDRSPDRSP